MNTNERALQLLEQNRYEESLDQFQKAVQQERTVQSLTNLAWMYCNEMEEDEKAFPLLQEAISLNPTSPFPFRLLGEMDLREEKWLLAEKILIKSINIAPSRITYYNLGIAYYKLSQFKKAASYFLMASDDSDYSFYGYVVCLIKEERKSEAKKQMKAFRRDAPNFVGEIEMADLYVELHCYKEAVTWYEKGWNDYFKDPHWISGFMYALFQMNDMPRAQELLQSLLMEKKQNIKDAKEDRDESWSEDDRKGYIKDELKHLKEFENMIKNVASLSHPELEFTPSFQTDCYLFGCPSHHHPEYNK